MDKEDIRITDLHRLVIGDHPWGFALEVLGRTVIIYLCLMVVMRLLGKRMNAQLTIMDLAVMLTLGAIASVPMQAFDRGVLPGIILLVSILLLHQVTTLFTYSNRKFEVLTQGKVTLIIKNGTVDTEMLKRMRISKDQLFQVLRTKGVRHLGEVKRLYSEADGHFSLFRADDIQPGLSVLPRIEEKLPSEATIQEGQKVCTYCGYVVLRSKDFHGSCSNCGNKEWTTTTQ